MKILIPTLLAICICSCQSTAPKTTRDLVILLNGQYQAGDVTGDLDQVIQKLGQPKETAVVIRACRMEKYTRVASTISSVKNAGFRSVGFITLLPSDPLCANNSFKPTPLRGAA